MTILEMLNDFLGMFVVTVMFGLIPGIAIGAKFHNYIYDEKEI